MSNLRDIQPTRPIREEILELATTLADSTARLHRLVERLDEREEDIRWKARCEDLERSNEELRRRLDLHQPEVNNALDARAAAFKRLKHARKVIRDLLEERNDMHSPRQGSVTQADIDEALFDNNNNETASSSSSSSGKTVHPRSSSMETFVTPRTGISMQTSAVLPAASTSSVRSAEAGPSSSIKSPVTSTHAPSSESNLIQLPVQRQESSGGSPVPETLALRFTKPPSTAVVRLRLDWEELQQILRLKDDAWGSLQSLRSSTDIKDLGMKFEIMGVPGSKHTLAFLCDPIFVEHGKKAYSVCWGRAEKNEELTRRIAHYKEDDSIFHTFTSPTSGKEGYYIGAHVWSVVEFRGDLWPEDRKNRSKIVKKLFRPTTHGEVDELEAEMSRLIDAGELRQFCVELTGVEDSSDFTRKYFGKVRGP